MWPAPLDGPWRRCPGDVEHVMAAASPIIRTPDQRLRIFVSSTLRELAPERLAALEAIRGLKLTPVLFELGARPHPPRRLYRAYLDQSHVFVGIYGEGYGWIAPGMEISGLEDEYLLSGDRPKLIYVKEPISARDERLKALLQRIEEHDRACYKTFSSPQELRTMLADDLAVLLSERFETSGAPARPGAEPGAAAGGRVRRSGLWHGAAAVALAVAVAAGAWLSQRAGTAPSRGAAAEAGEKRIAVLPFKNVGLAEDNYFADGMTDEVRSKLARLSGLAVIARASASEYADSAKKPQEIARELGVGYLLGATVRWQKAGSGSRVRVTPELVEVASEAAPVTRWQSSFDAEIQDVFRVQAEIATKVAEALVALGDGERGRLGEPPTTNVVAYDAYLKGKEIEKSGVAPGTLRLAAGKYEQAVALDPGFALAWAQLASARSLIFQVGATSSKDAQAAREAADRALAIAPEMPEGHWAMGTYQRLVAMEPARALESFALGLRLAPDHTTLLSSTALAERDLGRWHDALAHLQRARRLDPRSWRVERLIANTLLYLRRYPEVREAADRGLAIAPKSLDLYQHKVMSHLGEGDLPGARAVVAEAMDRIDPTAVAAYFAWYFGLGWVFDEKQLDLLLRLTPSAFSDNRGAWAATLAEVYEIRGETEKARQYAEEARQVFAAQLQETPHASTHLEQAWILTVLGRPREAVAEAERGAALVPISKNAYLGPVYLMALCRIYIRVGDHRRALDVLEVLLRTPFYVSPAWLRIEPDIDPLRNDPRFQKLAQGRAPGGD